MTNANTNAKIKPGAAIAPGPKLEDSERFAMDVLRKFGASPISVDVPERQKQLIQGYFLAIRKVCATQKIPLDALIFDSSLAEDLLNCARLGLDMREDAHLYPVPYRDNNSGRYTITLIRGYNGIKYIAQKYALDPPVNVTCELIYETDQFRVVKKSGNNAVEEYGWEITNPFARGDIVGGFGYIEYSDKRKNKIVLMSKAEMDKRRKTAKSDKFWEPWTKEMYDKTLIRHVYSAKHIQRDPLKVDYALAALEAREARQAQLEADFEIHERENLLPLDIPPEVLTPTPTPPTLPPAPPAQVEFEDDGEVIPF
jgi:recombination protein RecT